MTAQYQDYLESDAWKEKRIARIKAAKFRCEACGNGGALQVHHLTYARIFREEMTDLVVLCKRHHEAAEEMISSGKLLREGDVQMLYLETIKLLSPKAHRRAKKAIKKRHFDMKRITAERYAMKARQKQIARDKAYYWKSYETLRINALKRRIERKARKARTGPDTERP